jgi:hypothetical protein
MHSIHPYFIYPAIQFAKKNVFQFNGKKDNGNLIDTSIVFSGMGVA